MAFLRPENRKTILLFTLMGLFLFAHVHSQDKGFEHFISAEGNKLMDGNREFRFISMNIPNLNFVEDELEFSREHPYRLPDEFEIRDAMKTVSQMGGKVIRIYTLPVKRSDEADAVPAYVSGPGRFNEEAFRTTDLMLKLANEEGVRIIFPLLNNWKWMGGVPQYAEFRAKAEEEFWTDPQLIMDFKKTIAFALNRTNTLTGVKYKDDKAILCWETGNELMSPESWVKEIAAYIKSIDRNHLLMDGYFAIDNQRQVYESSVLDPNIDIVSSHHYEQDPISQLENIQKNLDVIRGRKPYVLGELGFSSNAAIERVYDFIIAREDIAGTLNWSIRSHRREGGFYWHSEPVGHDFYKAYHWPGFSSGEKYGETGLLHLMRTKAYEISGTAAPALPVPDAPALLTPDHVYAISWQGSAGASGYNIERSGREEGPWEQIAFNVSDAAVQYGSLYNDRSAVSAKEYFYRIQAMNASGVSGWSNVAGPVKASGGALIDEMSGPMNCYQVRELDFTSGQDRKFREDSDRLKGQKGSEVVYYLPANIESIHIHSFEQHSEAALSLMVSTDGMDYQSCDFEVSGRRTTLGDYGYWDALLYSSYPEGAAYRFLKIVFQREAQVGRIQIVYQ